MLPAWLWSIFVVIGSLTPSDAIPEGLEQLSDKGIHFFLHFVVALLTAIGLMKANHGRGQYVPIIIVAVVYSILLGACMEFLQGFIPGRFGDVLDFAADAIGASLAVPLILLYTYRCID